MSNRLVKCNYCSLKNKQKDSYKHVLNGKNVWFCNESHYIQFYKDKENRQKILAMCNDLFGIRVSSDTLFLKELKEYSDNYEALANLIEDKFLDLDLSLSKEFKSLIFKIKYFFAIIKRDIQNYISKSKDDNVVAIPLEITETNFRPRKRKKTILEILEETE